MYLYIHGFLSSSRSHKTQVLKGWLAAQGRGDEWVCPDLSVDPHQAIQQLSQCIEDGLSDGQQITIMGSSLGGFYASLLAGQYDLPAVLINPAVNVSELLSQRIGIHKAWHSDEQVELTYENVEQLRVLESSVSLNPDALLVLLEKGDESLDYRLAEQRYYDCHRIILNGGDHSFSRFEPLLPFIDSFFE